MGDPMFILAHGEHTRGAYTLVDQTIRPGNGAPPHRHAREDEAFYILTGRFLVVVDGQSHELEPGDYAYVPRGIVHAFKNINDAPARLLILLSPSGVEAFYREMADLPDPPPIDQVMALAAKYEIEVVGPPL
jgi:quercetin dioxygenase-like cupin family protein